MVNVNAFETELYLYSTQTATCSFIQRRHPSYIALRNMGSDIVPLLLQKLLDYPRICQDHWMSCDIWVCMTLLAEITQAHPWDEQANGQLELLRQAWLGWGNEQGIIRWEAPPRKTLFRRMWKCLQDFVYQKYSFDD